MTDSSLLKQRNKIKMIGSAATVSGALLCGDPNSLMIDGPGVMTGLCLFITALCLVFLLRGNG